MLITSLSRLMPVAALALMVGAGGCKKKAPEPAPEPPPVEQLSVVSITPDTGKPNTSFDARVNGSSFAAGASVTIGGQNATNVSVVSGNSISLTVPALPIGTYDVVVTNVNLDAATLRSGLTVKNSLEACAFYSVKYPFDVHAISSSERTALSDRMACYQLGGSIKIEGHADERGTVDYNLALGQRRADAVSSFLGSGGVSSSRISTVSYGEERPVSTGSNEDAWSQNRRADVNASE